MSLKNVELFYERLLVDEVFKQKVENAGSKEKCSLIVKTAGYDFTQQELEEYTERSLEFHASEQGIRSLSERELETIAGGMLSFIVRPPMIQKYGGVPPVDDFLL